MSRYLNTVSQAGDLNGIAIAGATLSFFEAGPTSTFLATFQDEDLTIENTNPVVADGQGRFPDIWLQLSVKYYVVLRDADGVILDDHDNVVSSAITGALTLENIAALTALPKSDLIDGEVFEVDGYYVQGDGGGGTLYWDAASVVAADNGVTFETDEGGTGRWIRILNGISPTYKMFGATGDGVTDDTAALQAAFNSTFNLVGSAGEYSFNSTLTFVGNRRRLDCDTNCTLVWSGATGTVATQFGDGSTLNQYLVVTNFRVFDTTAGNDSLILMNKCKRSAFYNMFAGANGTGTQGAGLVFNGSDNIILNFYNLISTFNWNGVLFETIVISKTVGVFFYGCQIEGQNNDGIVFEAGASTEHIKFYGGVIEAIERDAVRIDGSIANCTFVGTYFEGAGGVFVNITHSSASPLMLFDHCRFQGVSGTASITVSAPMIIKAENCEFTLSPLIELISASALYIGKDNFTGSAETEVIDTAGLGKFWTELIGGTGFKNFVDLKELRVENRPVPSTQQATEVSVPGGGSTNVVFNIAFSRIPTVMATVIAAAANLGSPTVISVTTTGFTLHNHEAGAKNIGWIAFEGEL